MASWNHFCSRMLHFATFDGNVFLPPAVLCFEVGKKNSFSDNTLGIY